LFKSGNKILGYKEIIMSLKTQFSRSFELFKKDIVFYGSYKEMHQRNAIILSEHATNEFLRDCMSAYYEDFHYGGDLPDKPFYDENDGYENTPYSINSNKLRENYEKRYNKKLGTYDMTFEFSSYIPNDSNDCYYAFPENEAELLIAVGTSDNKKSPNDECLIVNVMDKLDYLKEDKYKYSDFYTYGKVLILQIDIFDKLTSQNIG
jgi:hypothetical protein